MSFPDPRYPEGYNGWTNKETWIVFLWLTQDSEIYSIARDSAQMGAENLHQFVTSIALSPETSLANDLVISSLNWVNWKELAWGLKA